MKITKQIFFMMLLVFGLNVNGQSYSDGFTVNGHANLAITLS